MDKKKVVIYLGTFSKVLFPGIRVGWIAADQDCIKRLMAIKRFVDLTSSTLVQAALSAFIRNGYYDLHLKRMHRMFRKRLTVALNALQENMPATVTWTRPDGGYTIWVSLKNSYQDERLFKTIMIKNGVLVSPGAYYFHLAKDRKYFRISISTLNEEEIKTGISRLGRALVELIGLRKLS
jgi:DNA-binding transcriptional MocR family regulator